MITLILCVLLTSCFAWNLLSADKASKKVSDSREMKTTGQDTVTQEGEEMYQEKTLYIWRADAFGDWKH